MQILIVQCYEWVLWPSKLIQSNDSLLVFPSQNNYHLFKIILLMLLGWQAYLPCGNVYLNKNTSF